MKDMIVRFTGTMVIPADERPDDRGAIGHWLLNFMDGAINQSESTDEAFGVMGLHLTLEEAE